MEYGDEFNMGALLHYIIIILNEEYKLYLDSFEYQEGMKKNKELLKKRE